MSCFWNWVYHLFLVTWLCNSCRIHFYHWWLTSTSLGGKREADGLFLLLATNSATLVLFLWGKFSAEVTMTLRLESFRAPRNWKIWNIFRGRRWKVINMELLWTWSWIHPGCYWSSSPSIFWSCPLYHFSDAGKQLHCEGRRHQMHL